MIGTAQGNVWAATCDDGWHRAGLWEDEGEGAWPEGKGELLRDWGPLGNDCAGHGFIGYMDDEGVARGAALEGKDAFDGLGVEGISAKAIDGLGWKGDQATITETADGGLDDRCSARHEGH